jgi:predicted nucleotide-binding protein (sugar kinase/HSP70/actin superfamily)
MPFASDALAAAVAKQTGSEVVVPPNPGTVGALGIACLARRELAWRGRPGLDLRVFQTAQVERKTTFVCQSKSGCGGAGNKCRVERLETVLDGRRQTFTWGGSCSLYDQGVRRRKLPDRAPNPFSEREELVRALLRLEGAGCAAKRVAVTDELMLKSVFPFFARYLAGLGFAVEWVSGGDQETLKRGIQESQVPFCAPVQLFHGVAAAMRGTGADYLLAPVMRSMAHVGCEACCTTCPLIQGAPDLLRQALAAEGEEARLLTPEFRFGAGDFRSAEFMSGCRQLAAGLGVRGEGWRDAWSRAVSAQEEFDRRCLEIGERALRFCAECGALPVVVLGRPYTLYHPVLNANVPSLLREQGAVAVPVDCYPVRGEAPVFARMYWGSGQRILRAARQVRASAGQYAVYCSNYACGPDSFNLHLFAYEMAGKPFAVIETDGHAGDAGTKTRLEAFLYCVEQDRQPGVRHPSPNDLATLSRRSVTFSQMKDSGSTVLVPWMGPASDMTAAALRGAGLRAEAMAMPDRESLLIGRRHTSGKECLPMCLTLGRLIERLQREPGRSFTCVMPETDGPCRFGLYHQLDKLVLERLGLGGRCTFLTPHCDGYFSGMPDGFPVLLMAGIMASDHLQDALLQVRPSERSPGVANAVRDRYHRAATKLLERFGRRYGLGLGAALWEVASGRLFGLRRLMARAAADLALARAEAALPEVLVVGEIYVRGDAFANDNVVDKLEALGCRVRMTPMHEWLLFVDACNRTSGQTFWSDRLRSLVERRVKSVFKEILVPLRLWRDVPGMEAVLAASKAYVSGDLGGDAVPAIGRSLCDWASGKIDAVVNVGPLECMPTRFVQAQLAHMAEKEGLPSLTLSYNGDPMTPTALQSFAFDVQTRFRGRPREEVCARTQPVPGGDSQRGRRTAAGDRGLWRLWLQRPGGENITGH